MLIPQNLVAAPPASDAWPLSPLAAPFINRFQSEVRDSIFAFDESEWDALVPRDEPQLRFNILRAAETSRFAIAPRYLAVRREGRLQGVGVAVHSDIDVLLLAAPALQRAAAKLRRGPFSRLGVLRTLACGPLLTNCRPNLYINAALSPSERAEVADELARAFDALPGGGLRLAFEFSESEADDIGPAFNRRGYMRVASLPGTRLNIHAKWHELEDYVAAMRKVYRRAVRHDQALGRDLDIQIVADFSHLASEAFALYANVLERASNVVSRLTPEFFAALGNCENARLVTARERETGKLVGIELLLLGDTVVQDLYTGVDYGSNARYNTYFNLIYPGIALACETGVAMVSTGQTSYEFKSRLGVQAFPLFAFLKHRNPLINALLRRFRHVICPETATPSHHVFRAPDV